MSYGLFHHCLHLATRALVWCCLGGVVPSVLSAQEATDSFSIALVLPGGTYFATADNLGNVYRITASNSIEKYAPDGRLLSGYSNNRLGRATVLDVTNPLKTLAWYAEFRTVLFLDRSLTVLGELNLLQAGYPEVRTVASSRDGNLWIYDEVAFRLRKITPEGVQLYESQHLGQLFLDKINMLGMKESDNRLYASDADMGMLVFDAFAQFQEQYLPEHPGESFEVRQDVLYYTDSTYLYAENMPLHQVQHTTLPAVAASGNRLNFAENRLLVWNPEVLYVLVK